jgi:hypothetical protein
MGFWPHLADDLVHDFLIREALMRRADHLADLERDRIELEARVKAVEQAVTDRVRRGGVMH